MHITLDTAAAADEYFLWEILVEAAHLAADGEASVTTAQQHLFLAKFVRGWGRPRDLGVIARDATGERLGAAWVRHLTGLEQSYPEVDAAELRNAAAYTGFAIGALVLTGYILVVAVERHPAQPHRSAAQAAHDALPRGGLLPGHARLPPPRDDRRHLLGARQPPLRAALLRPVPRQPGCSHGHPGQVRRGQDVLLEPSGPSRCAGRLPSDRPGRLQERAPGGTRRSRRRTLLPAGFPPDDQHPRHRLR